MLSQLDGKLLILKGGGTWGAKGGKFYRGFDFIPATLYSLNCVRVIDSKTSNVRAPALHVIAFIRNYGIEFSNFMRP